MRADEVQSTAVKIATWKPAVAGVAAGLLAACSASLPSGDLVTGAVGETANFLAETERAPGEAKPTAAVAGKASGIAALAKAHASNTSEPNAALAYGRALKREGKRQEALAVLDTAAEADPKHHGIRLEQGLVSLELGQTVKAETALQQAATAPVKDWRVYSGLGIAASSLGRQKEAQGHFAKALELSPDNGAVLNNMAVSLILDRKVEQAETLLRRAAKSGVPRQQVAQNLALTRALKSEALADETSNQ